MRALLKAIQFCCACKICHKLLITSLSPRVWEQPLSRYRHHQELQGVCRPFFQKGKKDSKRTFSSQRYCYCCVLLLSALPATLYFTLVNVPLLLLLSWYHVTFFSLLISSMCTHEQFIIRHTTRVYTQTHMRAEEQPKNVCEL